MEWAHVLGVLLVILRQHGGCPSSYEPVRRCRRISAPTRTHYPLTVGTHTMTSHVLSSKKKVSVVAFTAAVCLSSLPQFARSFVQITPAMSSASRYTPTRLDRTGGRPAPFVTVSSSGSTIESALGSLGSLVRHEMGDGLHLQGRPRCEIGVLFYTQREAGGVQEPHGGGNGVEDALVGFHSCLPFIDQIIASPTLATSTSRHGEEEGTEEARRNSKRFTATLTLINNPEVKVDTFVMSPAPDRRISSSLREEAIGANVARALKRSTVITGESPTTCLTSTEPDNFEVICLAFGADGDAGTMLDSHDIVVDPCISQLHRLNSLLRDSGSRVVGGVPCRRFVSRCPLVASITAAKGGVFVSRRDEETSECHAVAGDVVGAILSGSFDSATSFQLVHAGKHAALRGSQFRIKRMKGGNIAEVMPVLPIEGVSSPAAPISGVTSDGEAWRRPRCGGGVVSAAEWCRHAVTSSTLFEKLAMQSALGVGVLKRMGADDEKFNGINSCLPDYPSAEIARAPLGVMPCLPAQTCFDVQEVEVDGSLRLSQEAPVGELRAGDLCDFRAVGSLAAMQAEQDAYSWLHASRISAAIRRQADDGEQRAGASLTPGVQGCLVASAGARFAAGFEDEGCDEVVLAASGHGGCPTVGIVSDVQLVSVDNTMLTCSSNAGLASIYVCGEMGVDD